MPNRVFCGSKRFERLSNQHEHCGGGQRGLSPLTSSEHRPRPRSPNPSRISIGGFEVLCELAFSGVHGAGNSFFLTMDKCGGLFTMHASKGLPFQVRLLSGFSGPPQMPRHFLESYPWSLFLFYCPYYLSRRSRRLPAVHNRHESQQLKVVNGG